MYQRLIIGNKRLNLKTINSTNVYLKQYVSDNKREVEGLVVVAENQFAGKGQKGNSWISKRGMNLTFSIFLKPSLPIQNQFMISKIISLGIINFLDDLGLNELKIKWPNDIYCGNNKISGILIENSVKEGKINHSIVGIGLNVNQKIFDIENNITSVIIELGGKESDLDELLNQLLFFIEKQYVKLIFGNDELINQDYLNLLLGCNESRKFKIKDDQVEGIILGVGDMGKLRVKINKEISLFDMKEIEFLIE